MCLARQITAVYIYLEQNNIFPAYIKKYPSAVGWELFHSKTPFQPDAVEHRCQLVRVVP